MAKLIWSIIWVSAWMFFLVLFENTGFIQKPGWWATYGAIMALILDAGNRLIGDWWLVDGRRGRKEKAMNYNQCKGCLYLAFDSGHKYRCMASKFNRLYGEHLYWIDKRNLLRIKYMVIKCSLISRIKHCMYANNRPRSTPRYQAGSR